MSAREKRVLRRALKGFVATLIAQAVLVLQQGVVLTPETAWQYLVVPAAVAALLALEKGLQPEKRSKETEVPHG